MVDISWVTVNISFHSLQFMMLQIFVCMCMKNETLQQHNLSSWRHRWKRSAEVL